MAKKKSTKAETPSEDPIVEENEPDPIDDDAAGEEEVVEPHDTVPGDANDNDDEEKTEKPTVLMSNAEKRQQISKRYQEKRDTEEAEEAESVVDAQPQNDTDQDDQDDEGDSPPEEENDPDPAPAPSDDPEIEMVIDGKTVKKTLSEVKAIAQRNIAADNRLSDAKEILALARQIESEARGNTSQGAEDGQHQSTPPDEAQPDKTTAPEQTILEQDELKNIVEQVQTGDESEGQEALLKFANHIVKAVKADQPSITQDDLQDRVTSALKLHQEETDTRQVMDGFAEKNKDLLENHLVHDAVLTAVREEMRGHLSRAITPEQLADLDKTPGSIPGVYRGLRQRGFELPALGNVMDAAATQIRTTFKLDKPTPSDSSKEAEQVKQADSEAAAQQKRVDRKRAAQNQQPRTSGGRQKTSAPPKGKTPQEYLQAERERRGFQRTG